MKKVIACAAMLLALAGCSSPPSAVPDAGKFSQFAEVTHKLNNGRTVTCLLWDQGGGYDSGMSCDWANAK
jgi:hypothetical protein